MFLLGLNRVVTIINILSSNMKIKDVIEFLKQEGTWAR